MSLYGRHNHRDGSVWTFVRSFVKVVTCEHLGGVNVRLQVCIPLCCKPGADLGSEGGRHLSGQEEVGEVLILGRTMFPEMKSLQQEEEEEKEDDLFWQKVICIHNI